MKYWLIAVPILLLDLNLHAGTESPYQGEQFRNIKSLSQSDIDGYLSGKGMGFAKAAELNHYPGPRHVLDLSEQLKLSNKQQAQSQALFEQMQDKAVKLGKKLIDQEKKLDIMFANGAITDDSLEKMLQNIGLTRAKLRHVHLSTHLKQKQILSNHQIMRYDQLRGYDGNGRSGGHDHKHMH